MNLVDRVASRHLARFAVSFSSNRDDWTTVSLTDAERLTGYDLPTIAWHVEGIVYVQPMGLRARFTCNIISDKDGAPLRVEKFNGSGQGWAGKVFMDALSNVTPEVVTNLIEEL